MIKLRMLTAREVERILLIMGFQKVRQKGSHVFFRHEDGRTTTVPFHAGRTIARPLLRSILRDIQLSVQEFEELFS